MKRERAYAEAVLSETELLQRQTQQMLIFCAGDYVNFIAALKNTQIDFETQLTLDNIVNQMKGQ